ncbi:MAG: pirin [Nocardioides sp.]|nr:pirin [Nocardioides sp.]
MSNVETRPDEVACGSTPADADVSVLEPREVPLGGPRAMTVRRTLPARGRTMVGAWCFADHYGPDLVGGPDGTGGMTVPPHPHTGLQTVSWLFEGEITHRDSAGHHAQVLPGELNLMTAGRGISHSEVSTADTEVLHGAQLWVALPAADRATTPRFDHYAPDVVALAGVGGPGADVRVFLGSLAGSTSPVATASPLLGAEVVLAPGADVDVAVDAGFEHGVLVDTGVIDVHGSEVLPGALAHLGTGRTAVRLRAGDEGARVLLLGGRPLGEQVVMWWNFVGADHDEVVAARADWQAQVTDDGLVDGRFGRPVGETLPPVPAPTLPGTRLRPRG